jgi:hypothetical protein
MLHESVHALQVVNDDCLQRHSKQFSNQNVKLVGIRSPRVDRTAAMLMPTNHLTNYSASPIIIIP